MQYLRGYKLMDPKNYNHSFVEEIQERGYLPKFNVSRWALISVIISLLLYVLKLNGIVIY